MFVLVIRYSQTLSTMNGRLLRVDVKSLLYVLFAVFVWMQ